MQLLLGLFFLSVLLTTGSSLQCLNCFAINGYCSGVKHECPAEADVCMTVSLQNKEDKPKHANIEICGTKMVCKKMEDLIGKPLPEQIPTIPGLPGEVIIKEVVCSKAPPSFASFFPAFIGLLLMKLLF